MTKKRYCFVLLILFLVFFILFFPSVSANFVCGVVNSSDEVLASWFDVNVYYQERPDKKTTCKVSPSDNKYCCDPQEIKGVSWAIGKTVNAEIFNNGYITDRVSLQISGEGYDIFPLMKLEKVIILHEPKKSVFLNTDKVFVNVSSLPGFNNLRYMLNYSGNLVAEEEICFQCNHAEFYLENLSFGQYEFSIIAENDAGDRVSEKKKITVLEHINFDREIECGKCRRNFVPRNTEINMTIHVEFSHSVSGKLFDYFPNDWELISEEEVEEFSDTHDRISWDISGDRISRSYRLKSPGKVFPRRYFFESYFNEYRAGEDLVVLYRFFRTRFFSFLEEYFVTSNIDDSFVYSSVSDTRPLVMKLNSSVLTEIAIFPKHEVLKAKGFVLHKFELNEGGFMVRANIKDEEIEKILIRFKINRKDNASLFNYNIESRNWEQLKIEKYKEDSENLYYESYAEKKGSFLIIKDERRGFFSNLIFWK